MSVPEGIRARVDNFLKPFRGPQDLSRRQAIEDVAKVTVAGAVATTVLSHVKIPGVEAAPSLVTNFDAMELLPPVGQVPDVRGRVFYNQDGTNLTKWLDLTNNGVKLTQKGADGKFTSWKFITDKPLPMDNPRSLAIDPIGNTIMVVGEKVTGLNKPAAACRSLSDFSGNWLEVPAPDSSNGSFSGVTYDQATNRFVVSRSGNGGIPAFHIYEMGNQLVPANLMGLGSPNLEVRSSAGGLIKAAAPGSETAESGLNLYDINPLTAVVTKTNILANYGTLEGFSSSVTNGQETITTAAKDTKKIIRKNLSTGVETVYSFAGLLNGKGFSDFVNNGFNNIKAIREDATHIIVAGSYSSASTGVGRAVIAWWPKGINPETNPGAVIAVAIEPTRAASVGWQKNLEIIYDGGVEFISAYVTGVGEVLVNKQTLEIKYPNKGLYNGDTPDSPMPYQQNVPGGVMQNNPTGW